LLQLYFLCWSSQWTKNFVAKKRTILPVSDILLTLHQLYINIVIVLVILNNANNLKKTKYGTQLPGPFDIKWVVFNN
jgi:hypothetical protein